MIAIAVECLMEVGLADFKIAVSQVEFLRGLFEQLQLPNAGNGKFRPHYIARRAQRSTS